jgi:hypothetical protein
MCMLVYAIASFRALVKAAMFAAGPPRMDMGNLAANPGCRLTLENMGSANREALFTGLAATRLLRNR